MIMHSILPIIEADHNHDYENKADNESENNKTKQILCHSHS